MTSEEAVERLKALDRREGDYAELAVANINYVLGVLHRTNQEALRLAIAALTKEQTHD